MPVQPPPMVPPQKSSSHPALFIAGTTLLAIAISYLGYQNWQLKQQVNRLDKLVQVDNPPLSSPTDSSDPTASQAPNGDLANWKTYTNNDLRVNFKHPSGWVITETSIGVVLLKDPDIRMVIGACPGYSFSVSKYDPYLNYSRFDKVVKSELDGKSTETWTSNDSKCKEKVIFINALPSNDLKPKYIISFISKNSDGDKILDHILSTFKFTANE